MKLGLRGRDMISQVIYGLLMFNSKTPGISDYLEFICERVEEAKQGGRKNE